VNNAVHWAVVEETLPDGPRRGRGEVEYLTPLDPGGPVELVTTTGELGEVSCWLVAGEAVLTAARWTLAP
jgi:acyl-ACP thioesterase